MTRHLPPTQAARIILFTALAACAPPTATATAPASASASAPATASAPAPATATAPASASTTASTTSPPAHLTSTTFPLRPTPSPASVDYITLDPSTAALWIPLSDSGEVARFDTTTNTLRTIGGFKTVTRDQNGRKRTMGPNAVAVGDGSVYVGDRASGDVCPVDPAGAAGRPPCIALPSPSDGVVYVGSTHEVWVTMPGDRSLAVLDAPTKGALKVSATVRVDGRPEGYAVDDAHGIFFTNLEDSGGTVVIDVAKRAVRATWNAGCGPDGPRGLAFDAAHDFVIVACTDHLQVLDAAHDGARLGTLDTGAGVDNIDVVGDAVYVAAGKAARLSIARIEGDGRLVLVAAGDTAEGARNAVGDARGRAYVVDARRARLIVFSPPAP